MNTEEYISGGIVESYVLGLASEEERKEFEIMCAQHPEVLQARTAFELALEKQAMENAIAPPAELKSRILSQVGATGKLVAMPSERASNLGWLRYAAAACLILLAGSLYWNITLFNKNKNLKDNYNTTAGRLNDMEKDIRILQQNPNIKMASMKGLDVSPQSYATVYWDTTSHDVYLLTNNLPVPASDQQYQLWAIFDKKPVDLGVFDIKKERLLIQAKNAQGAEAFAITLEKKGGSTTPQGTMYVMGKL
ncbi:MAG: anti-sigma factor [Ferruginibacter sp.]|nr:anti-sigma factor [Chitinophagaceae bacterium]